ncbi:MAG: hypothetical protein H7837_10335 [Magnetococcus sp. MYC-9]
MSPLSPSSEKQMPFFRSQVVEDWLFAYANARNNTARETMWPHLVEAIEELIAESRQQEAQETGR